MAHLAPLPAQIAPDLAAWAARGARWIGRRIAAILDARQKAADRDIRHRTARLDPLLTAASGREGARSTRPLILAVAALALTAPAAWAESAPVAAFGCADRYYVVLQDAGPAEPFGLHDLHYDGRRLVQARTPARMAQWPQDLCAEVAAICGGAGLTLASARPVAPSCLRPH